MGQRKKANLTLISKNNFLKNTLKVHPSNQSLVLCTLCSSKREQESDWMLWESLESHLRANDHIKKAKKVKRDSESEAAADFLRDSKSNKRASSSSKQITPTKNMNSSQRNIVWNSATENIESERIDIEPQPFIYNLEEYFHLQMAIFIIQNNIPFYHAHSIANFINNVNQIHCTESLLTFDCNDSHITKIISKVIAPILKESYFTRLESNPFSLAIDASTNANVEYLAINGRYFEHDYNPIPVTKLISLLKVKESCTGQAIFDSLKKVLFEGTLGLKRQKNLVGIVTDGASNMISNKGAGAANRLQGFAPQVIIVHDICHCINLIMKKCIQSFPDAYRVMAEKICQTFSKSAVKTARLQSVMKQKNQECESVILAIRKHVPTRW